MWHYNNNIDLYFLSAIFLSKRLFSKNYSQDFEEEKSYSKNPFVLVLWGLLSVWFFLLLIKICMNSSLECALLLIYPLITWILMVKFTSKKYVKCKHPNCSKPKDSDNRTIEWAPFEVLQIIKRWIFHTGEWVWFWVLLPLGFLENNDLYVNSIQTIMSGLSVAGNSFILLATLYLSKYAKELSNQAKYFGYWNRISESKASELKDLQPKSLSNEGAVIQYDGYYYVGMWEINNIHNKPGDTLTYLLYILFNSPGRTYIMLLVSQALLTLSQLLYCCFRTQFLFPTIQAGLSVFVLWYISKIKSSYNIC